MIRMCVLTFRFRCWWGVSGRDWEDNIDEGWWGCELGLGLGLGLGFEEEEEEEVLLWVWVWEWVWWGGAWV